MFDQLYSELILEHSRTPLNTGEVEQGEGVFRVQLRNPLCGDEIDLSVRLVDGCVEELKFTGHGCSISQAAASMMSQLVKGLSVEEVKNLQSTYGDLIFNRLDGISREDLENQLGDLIALEGVQKFPIRAKCALLGFEALERAIAKKEMD